MIETERLILRAPEPRDRAPLHAMWADPRVMADLGPVKTAADSDASLARHASYAPLGFWAVVRQGNAATIGFCGLKPGAPDTPIAGMLEVGWMLAMAYWGMGYAREAVAASIAWGWANRAEDAIVAITARQNAKSRALMARLGMAHVPALDFAHPMFGADDPRRDNGDLPDQTRVSSDAVMMTARLILRRWRDADTEPFHAMGQDTEVMRYLGPPMAMDECRATIERQNALAEETGSCFWAVERRTDETFIGFCGIKPGPPDTPISDQPEIGWRLAREAWGQGHALDAASACRDRAWGMGVPRIVAITVPANVRSRRLMDRIGLKQVADGNFDHPALPPGDPLRRHVLYALDRPAFDASDKSWAEPRT